MPFCLTPNYRDASLLPARNSASLILGSKTEIPAQLEVLLMTNLSALLLQNEGLAAMGATMIIVYLAIAVVCIMGYWKVLVKAGQPGWAILIPIYNLYVLLKIAGRPGWWLLLLLIPIVNIGIWIVVAIDIAKSFGQSTVFGVVLLFLLSVIGYLILGFGNYRYQGPSRATI
jgi:hypothetical protein